MSACQVCGYHSGPLTLDHQTCPMVHLYRPIPPDSIEAVRLRLELWEQSESANAPEMVDKYRTQLAEMEAAADERGAHQAELERHEAER